MGFPAKFLEAGAALDQRNLEPAQQPLLRPPFQAAPSYHPGAEEVVYFFWVVLLGWEAAGQVPTQRFLQCFSSFHQVGHFHDFQVAARAANLPTWASPCWRPTFGYATPEQCCGRACAHVPVPFTPKDQHPTCFQVLLFAARLQATERKKQTVPRTSAAPRTLLAPRASTVPSIALMPPSPAGLFVL